MSLRFSVPQLPCSFQPQANTSPVDERPRKCSLPDAREVSGRRFAGGNWPWSERPQEVTCPEWSRTAMVDQEAVICLMWGIEGIEVRLYLAFVV